MGTNRSAAEPPVGARQPRDRYLDIARGLAATTMVSANTAAYILEGPHPFFVRCYGSFAAPIFVTLAGMMVASHRERQLGRSLMRGASLLCVGALLDVGLWRQVPFVSFDVLYLLGLAIPFAYLAGRLPLVLRWLFVVVFFVAAQLAQRRFGYALNYVSFPLKEISSVRLPTVLQRVLVDGWFPVFPWMGFTLLGVALAPIRERRDRRAWNKVGWLGGVTLVVGIAAWLFSSTPSYAREGYSELFYPATTSYLVTAVGVIFTTFSLLFRFQHASFWWPLERLGQYSLLIYVLNYVAVRFLFLRFLPRVNLVNFGLVYVLFVTGLLGVAHVAQRFKERYPRQPYFIRVFIGN